jgi:hypothetical protein
VEGKQRMAPQMASYPNALRACIKQAGYSFREVSRETAIPESTLYDWAAGNRPIPHRERQVLARLLGCDEHDLQPQPADKGLLPTGTSFHEHTSHSSVFDLDVTEKLDSAESLITLAWEAWFASRPREVARSVIKVLPGLEKIAYSPSLPGHMLRAKHLATRAHGLLGSVCLDAAHHDTALFHYMQAQRFAEEIHDLDLATTYLCLMGDVLRQQHDQSGALAHMEQAREVAAHASKATRGHILQLLAYTYGDTGQEAAFEHTIAEATDLLAFSGEGIDIVQKEFIPFEIYEIRGKINRDLGKPLNALPYLELAEHSLTTADAVTPRWHALLAISRAQTHCDAGNMATGIELACTGFMMAYQCHSLHQMNRVRKLLRKLEQGPFRSHPRVQDLKNLLYETYMQME